MDSGFSMFDSSSIRWSQWTWKGFQISLWGIWLWETSQFQVPSLRTWKHVRLLKYNYYFTHVYIIYLFKLLYINSICMFFKYLSKSGWKMLKPHDSADLVDPPRLPLSHMPDVCAKPKNQRQIRGFHWGRKPTMDDQHFARSAEHKTGLEYCLIIWHTYIIIEYNSTPQKDRKVKSSWNSSALLVYLWGLLHFHSFYIMFFETLYVDM